MVIPEERFKSIMSNDRRIKRNSFWKDCRRKIKGRDKGRNVLSRTTWKNSDRRENWSQQELWWRRNRVTWISDLVKREETSWMKSWLTTRRRCRSKSCRADLRNSQSQRATKNHQITPKWWRDQLWPTSQTIYSSPIMRRKKKRRKRNSNSKWGSTRWKTSTLISLIQLQCIVKCRTLIVKPYLRPITQPQRKHLPTWMTQLSRWIQTNYLRL